MLNLIINKPDIGEVLDETCFGGLPAVPADEDVSWPVCNTCELPMQFLGQFKVENELLLIFMCQNDPGMCDDWDPESGDNKVIKVPVKNLVKLSAPEEGEDTVRDTRYGITVVEIEAENYYEARDKWANINQASKSEVLGLLFGEPTWIQADDTPKCNDCGNLMRFVAQFESGPDPKTQMNFGDGGYGYLFDCSTTDV